MYRLSFLSIVLLYTLTGCGFAPKTNTIEITPTKIEVVKIEEELLTPCIPERPMNVDTYLKLEPHERESYLTTYSTTLMLTIKECNIKLKKIKEFQEKE